jgi:AraC-like DNA-binding protein
MKDTFQAAIIEMREVLSQRIIPRISSKDPLRMILARLPLRLPADIPMRQQPSPVLRVSGKRSSHYFLAQYKREAMHAIRFPYFCYVVKGEIDMRLGIPPPSEKSRGTVNNYHVLTLPKQTLLLMPPGVFFPDGSRLHWERPSPPVPTQLFWLRAMPNGAACHVSNWRNLVPPLPRAVSSREIFVPDSQLAMLVEMLASDLQNPHQNAALAAYNALSLILLRVWRGLGNSAPSALKEENSFVTPSSPAHHGVAERACQFILTHLNKPLGIEDVAGAVYVSPSHLTRLFRAEMKTSIKQYVLQERLRQARYLLTTTDMSVQEIALVVGYRQTPQFNLFFKKAHQCTPGEYRCLHRGGKELPVNTKG